MVYSRHLIPSFVTVYIHMATIAYSFLHVHIGAKMTLCIWKYLISPRVSLAATSRVKIRYRYAYLTPSGWKALER